eukprot:CAMPEP_0184695136 /NCGR_PEP_ID=MMETSP0313-20130426/2866_1 /TAXON_ID=2792 /ORGANISM="Porphyridium aerugineum, Strain SAG 1380-2" /LENGTH=387 /DNA_ID=CAMNT_0027153535 /DNA_START=232 /DNA_END=1395 /DNA_ORIENTATION=-
MASAFVSLSPIMGPVPVSMSMSAERYPQSPGISSSTAKPAIPRSFGGVSTRSTRIQTQRYNPTLSFFGGNHGKYGNSNGSNNNGGRYGRGGGGQGDDSNKDNEGGVDPLAFGVSPSIAKVLQKYNRTANSIPADVRYSLQLGKASAEQLELVFQAESLPLGVGWLASKWAAFRNRLVGSPSFLMTVCVELAIGVVTKSAAELRSRKDKFVKELDFYFSDIALEIIADFFLVWLLSPVAKFGRPSKGALATALAKLPAHVLQKGSYSVPQRLATLASKSVQFGMVGFLSSIAGHSLTKYLVSLRGQPAQAGDAQLAPVLDNSIQWGEFMATSSTSRYMLVNGIENRLLSKLYAVNVPLTTALTAVLRFGNCYVGGVHWLWWAKQAKLQ